MEPVHSLDASVLAEFGGELRKFRLTVPFLAKVEQDCDAGPGVIAGELARAVQMIEAAGEQKVSALALIAAGLGGWRTSYVRQTIFHGLQGGGMSANDAAKLCREHIDERGFMGLLENASIAFGVMTGAYLGPKDDAPGESAGAGETNPPRKNARRSRTAAPATAGSTRPRASSAGRPATSPTPPSGN